MMMAMGRFWRLLLCVLCPLLVLCPPSAQAEPGASDWVQTEAGPLRLIAAEQRTGLRDSLLLGLHLQLRPGWKIYWRTPGDAGYPPKLDWSGSDNLEGAEISWPAPKRFILAGLQNYGYGGDMILPLTVRPAVAGQALFLRLNVDFLACDKICVPMQANLRLDLPSGPSQPSAFAHDLSRALAQVPGDGARHGLQADLFTVHGEGDASRLFLTVRSATPLQQPDLFVEPAELGSFEPPLLHRFDDGRRVILELHPAPGTVQGSLAARPMRLTVTDGERSFEITRAANPALPPVDGPPVAASPPSRLPMIMLALLGGLILNVMPCVLPVLSIKLLGVLQQGQQSLSRVRRSFLASALGIVSSFLLLAAVAIGLKMAGLAVGWGIQFQQPAFLLLMMLLLLLFAANLAGLFEFRLPGSVLSLGAEQAAAPTLLGNFLSGALATLLATPCSAPFLGTAVGFALARGPLDILLIFLALGTGMAGPYWLVAMRPSLAQRLPRPGRWMIQVKRGLALALLGTAVWLGSVLWGGGSDGNIGPDAKESRGSLPWRPFSHSALQQAVQNGQLVFVDVTADWCITCKVNKAATIEQEPVLGRLRQTDVLLLQADWTRPDTAIAAYLAGFGRYGIPFNAVYGPKAPNGMALPELPTADDILTALRLAK